MKVAGGKNPFLILLSIQIFFFLFSFLYFKNLFLKEKTEILREIKKSLLEKQIPEKATFPETISALKDVGIERYFLSEITLINGYYTPKIHLCLFKEEKPIYPSYIYDTWSVLTYPDHHYPQIALVRYLLLPQDNVNFQPNKACYIKEIKEEKDWQLIKENYGFNKEQF